LHAVDLSDKQEDRKGHDQEIQYGVEEYSVIDGGGTRSLGCGECGMSITGEINKEAGKIDLADQEADGGHEDIVDKGTDDLAEGGADNDPDSHIEDIPAHRKLSELSTH
jgi:hypothetical protein